MDSDRKTVRVTIFNQSYTLIASDEPGEVEALALRVHEIMTNVAQQSGNVDTGRTAVLACLHMADKMRTLEKDLAALRSHIEFKSGELQRLLDRVVD